MQTFSLPYHLRTEIESELERWDADQKIERLWGRDASVWTGRDEGAWLGWLDIVGAQLADMARFDRVSQQVAQGGFTDALLLGMGGSSLCPEVLSRTFASEPSHPKLAVLDSTDPARILRAEAEIDLSRTLFIVSSKSGTTMETRLLLDFFLDRVKDRVGPGQTGQQFVAITDAGSDLEDFTIEQNFRSVFTVQSDIGGRFSALSDFGLIPAAVIGLDCRCFLKSAERMVSVCGPVSDAGSNPGVVLGTVLGVLGRRGRDKLTLIASPAIDAIGLWIEQLIAESTGKAGKGLIPVDGERSGPPGVYSRDRVFVYLRLASDMDREQEQAVDSLEQAGHPVVRIEIAERYDLGQEFFRWELATAVAGAHLGLNPFDQPDVDASKAATRRIMSTRPASGSSAGETPIVETRRLKIFAPPGNGPMTGTPDPAGTNPADCLGVFLDSLSSGDYFAILAFLDMKPEPRAKLENIRRMVRDRWKVATTIGFGPRFLHSTGQIHKGGPGTGLFLEITQDDEQGLPIPGHTFTFSAVKAAQALGDMKVLVDRGRRVLRVHLVGGSLVSSLEALDRAVRERLARISEGESG